MTSRGQVTMPDAKPAPAPQMGETHDFGICVDCICIRAVKESREDVEDIVELKGIVSVEVAY